MSNTNESDTTADDPIAQTLKDIGQDLKETSRTDLRETGEHVAQYLGMLAIGIGFGSTWMAQRAVANRCARQGVFITEPCASELIALGNSIAKPSMYAGMGLLLLGTVVSPWLAPRVAGLLDGGDEAGETA